MVILVGRYVASCVSKTVIKLVTPLLLPVITSFFVFGANVQVLTCCSIFKEAKLKYGRWVNFETLININVKF